MIGVINSPSKKGILDEAKSYSDTKLTEAKNYSDTKLTEAKNYIDNQVLDKLTSCIRNKQSGIINHLGNVDLSGFKDITKMIVLLNGGTCERTGSSRGFTVTVNIPYCKTISVSTLEISGAKTSFEATDFHDNISFDRITYTVIEFY